MYLYVDPPLQFWLLTILMLWYMKNKIISHVSASGYHLCGA